MSSPETLPTSGYLLERVYAPRQSYEALPPSDEHPISADNLTLGWDWRVSGEDLFDVYVTARCDPLRERAERVEVTVVGTFRLAEEVQTVQLLEFVRVHAPSILMPYVREIIASLTGRGVSGAVHLPPLNVKAIMESMDPSKTTGMHQIRENPTLIRVLPERALGPGSALHESRGESNSAEE